MSSTPLVFLKYFIDKKNRLMTFEDDKVGYKGEVEKRDVKVR